MWGGFDDNDVRRVFSMHPAFASQRFDEYYRCYDVAIMPGSERENVNYGGKAILPPSALDKLSRLNVSYPMLFELTNERSSKVSHCGVLEFIAEEGRIYLPRWMMNTLSFESGDLARIKSTDLPRGSFVRIQPQHTSFLDISDPKAVLENALRNFSTLTQSDVFELSYNNQIYQIAVLEVKPEGMNNAISVVETDLEVDFAAPVGYVEPSTAQKSVGHVKVPLVNGGMSTMINYDALVNAPDATQDPFARGGQKLSGKTISHPAEPTPHTSTSTTITHQPLNLPFGTLFFGYKVIPAQTQEEKEAVAAAFAEEKKFSGDGNTLRKKRGPIATSASSSTIASGKSTTPVGRKLND